MSVKINKSLDDGLVLYLPLNEGSGTTGYDKSKYGNNGVISGTPVWEEDEDKGECLSFDGISNYMTVTHNSSLMPYTSDFAFSFFVLTDYTGTTQQLIIKRDWSPNDNAGFQIGIDITTGKLNFFFCDGTAPRLSTTFAGSITDGVWHHVVVNVDRDGVVSLYIDTVLDIVTLNISSQQGSVENTDNLYLGADYPRGAGAIKFEGRISEFRYYKRLLSVAEINQLYRLGVTKNLSDGLVLYVPMDEGSGSTGFDRSKNSHNAVVPSDIWEVDAEKGVVPHFNNLASKNLDIPASTDFDLQEQTVAFWFKADAINSLAIDIFSRRNGSTNWMFYRNAPWLNGDLGILRYYTKTDTTIVPVLRQYTFEVDTWYHVCFVFHPDGSSEDYIDGVLRGDNAIPADFDYWTTSTSKHYTSMQGYLKDVRIYNRALSSDEVSALYRLTKKGVE